MPLKLRFLTMLMKNGIIVVDDEKGICELFKTFFVSLYEPYSQCSSAINSFRNSNENNIIANNIPRML